MSKYLKEAMAIKDTIVADRRHIHANPEVGTELPNTVEYVKKRLTEMGYEPKEICKSGITASIGKKGGKTILLRADMDALPMGEESGLEFCSKNPNAAHTCGHDMHTSMLLGAAKLLKENEADLEGEVKLMFQPDEEALTGARAMIAAGILDGVDAAMALHVSSGKLSPGTALVAPGVIAASQDRFVIKVKGKGAHGAMPYLGVDPINVASHIVIALQEIPAREINPATPVVLTVGMFNAGSAANIIPETVEMQGTIRSLFPDSREHTKKRLIEICELTAKKFRAECVIEFPVETPCNSNNPELVEELSGYVRELGIELLAAKPGMGSEDFALVAEKVPSVFFSVASGGPEEKYQYSLHNPKVLLNEDTLPYGSAIFVKCATEYLKNHK